MKQYTENQLFPAIIDVNNGEPIAKASRKWAIPRSTLYGRINGDKHINKLKNPFKSFQKNRKTPNRLVTFTNRFRPSINAPRTTFFAQRILQAAGETEGLRKR